MTAPPSYSKSLPQDLAAGAVAFLVALPLCLGVALASGAPVFSGLLAGIVGGVVVAWLSGSHTSISGPSAGLTAVVATQIDALGTFDVFLLAVVLSGALQVVMGLARAGSLAAFFPSSVVKGLLAGIGIILVLKQIPHLFGHDSNWLGDLAFRQMDGRNSLSALFDTPFEVRAGPTLIGLASLALLLFWKRTPLVRSGIPAPLAVVAAGTALALVLEKLGGTLAVNATHLVQVPLVGSLQGFGRALAAPEFSAIAEPAVLVAAVTISVVASLETLLNVQAVDRLDPHKRTSPPNRELVAQGVGNMTSGLIGGLPVTSVVVRSSVGISAGGQTRMTSFVHGALLLLMVVLLPGLLGRIPLASLAAILLVTGIELARPALFQQMWSEGRHQFLPFIVTVAAIVLADPLIGIVIGTLTASLFILYGNLGVPIRRIDEQRASGNLLRIELPSQATFLNRAALLDALRAAPDGSRVVLDARNNVHMDPDIFDVIRDFEHEVAPAHGIDLAFVGFEDHEDFDDRPVHVDVTTKEIQGRVAPEKILQVLMDGNERFVEGRTIARNLRAELGATSYGQFPLAVVLACMDSRVATETIFDLGLGDLFSIRVAGNIAAYEQIGSLEYACAVAGAKLLIVLGHTQCGAVIATVDLMADGQLAGAEGLSNLRAITDPIAESVRAETETPTERHGRNDDYVKRVTALNVRRTMAAIRERSESLRDLIDRGSILMVGGVYDVRTGRVEILEPD